MLAWTMALRDADGEQWMGLEAGKTGLDGRLHLALPEFPSFHLSFCKMAEGLAYQCWHFQCSADTQNMEAFWKRMNKTAKIY